MYKCTPVLAKLVTHCATVDPSFARHRADERSCELAKVTQAAIRVKIATFIFQAIYWRLLDQCFETSLIVRFDFFCSLFSLGEIVLKIALDSSFYKLSGVHKHDMYT